MKKRLLICLLLTFLASYSFAQVPAFAWAKSMGNSGSDEYINGMKIDGSGNIYICGTFSGTMDFDPSPTTHNLVSHGGTDIFVAKYNGSGAYLWAYNIGDTGNDEGDDLVIDDSANVYICGAYNGIPDLDPGANTHYATADALENAFYVKLNKNGVYQRSDCYTSTNSEYARAIGVDANHNVYIAGICHALTIGTTNVGTHGGFDVFITKTNIAGNLQWAKEVGGSDYDYASNLAIDGSGNVYLSGSFSGTDFDVDPSAATYTFTTGGSNQNSFLVAISPSGTMNWCNNWGQSLTDDTGEDIAIGAANDSYQSANFGYTNESIAFRDNGAGVGVWGLPSTGATSVSIPSLTCDYVDNVFAAGSFSGNITWGGGMLSATGNTDIIVSKYNYQSALLWQFFLGGNGGDAATEIALGPSNTYFIAGVYTGNVDFNPSSSATNYLTASGGTDMFIMRLGLTLTGVEEQPQPTTSFNVYPNPVSDQLNLAFNTSHSGTFTMQLFTVDGKSVMTEQFENSATDHVQSFNISSIPAGLYILDVENAGNHEQQKIIKLTE